MHAHTAKQEAIETIERLPDDAPPSMRLSIGSLYSTRFVRGYRISTPAA
jgi:hypothetical protein